MCTLRAVRYPSVFKAAGIAVLLLFNFICFYWWIAGNYYFNGDELFYFSRQIGSFAGLIHRFAAVDDMYQYRPLTFVVFTFILKPLFGTSVGPYHAAAYVMTLVDTLLACALVYFWIGKRPAAVGFGLIYLLLNPINFFASFGTTDLDLQLEAFFYFSALLILLKAPREFQWLAVPSFLLALCSKEQAVMLPVQAFVMLVTAGVNWKDALKQTKVLGLALIFFMVFQLVIRHGALFAPHAANSNLEFDFSLKRIIELAQGAKAAIFYPENYKWDGLLLGHGRLLRLMTLLLPGMALLIAVIKKNLLALGGLVWAAAALPPVAFIHQVPFPRHYYLALPGIAVFFAAVIQNRRLAMPLVPLLAIFSLFDVALYAQESWVITGAQKTREYLSEVKSIAKTSGKTEFYFTSDSDPGLYWDIDGGAGVPYILGKDLRFQFASLKQTIPVDNLYQNRLNLVTASAGKIKDSFAEVPLAMGPTRPICSVIHELLGTSGRCTAIYKDVLLPKDVQNVAETPSGLPVFRVKEGIVTVSYGSFLVEAVNGLTLHRKLRLVPESRDGVVLEIYSRREHSFFKDYSRYVAPGERFRLDFDLPPGVATHAVLRIRRGPMNDPSADWLVWETP